MKVIWTEKCIACKRVKKKSMIEFICPNADSSIGMKKKIMWFVCDKCWKKGRRPKDYFDEGENTIVKFCPKCKNRTFLYKYKNKKSKKICKKCGHVCKEMVKNVRKEWDD